MPAGEGGLWGQFQSSYRAVRGACESGWGRVLAVGNVVGASVGVWECLWGRVRAGDLGWRGGYPPPLPFKRFPDSVASPPWPTPSTAPAIPPSAAVIAASPFLPTPTMSIALSAVVPNGPWRPCSACPGTGPTSHPPAGCSGCRVCGRGRGCRRRQRFGYFKGCFERESCTQCLVVGGVRDARAGLC